MVAALTSSKQHSAVSALRGGHLGHRVSDDFTYMTAIELLRLIRTKQASPVEIAESTLRRIEASQPVLNAFVTITPELAIDAARAAEKAVMSGQDDGLLTGLPLSIKDLTAVKGVRFTSGSRTLADFIAPVDSPASERVKAHGAAIVGKTTTTEFGCKGSSDSPLTGETHNPWNLAKTTGGSSAGAGASVAAGLTPFALGTDGGGSIRIPSSFCGLFGIKAQFGRVPVFPTAATPTLAHVGPIARSTQDAALLFTAIAGYDARDPFSVASSVPDVLGASQAAVTGLRIAYSPTLGYARPDGDVIQVVETAVRSFEELGCTIELVDQVFDKDPVELWTAEFYAGVGTRLRSFVETQRDLLDPAVAEVLDAALGQDMRGYYEKVFERYAFREKLRTFFERYDLLISPVLPVSSLDVGKNIPDHLTDRNLVSWVYYTYPFNLTGQPAATICAGLATNGMPVGLQIVGRALGEYDVVRAAAGYERTKPKGYNIKPSVKH